MMDWSYQPRRASPVLEKAFELEQQQYEASALINAQLNAMRQARMKRLRRQVKQTTDPVERLRLYLKLLDVLAPFPWQRPQPKPPKPDPLLVTAFEKTLARQQHPPRLPEQQQSDPVSALRRLLQRWQRTDALAA